MTVFEIEVGDRAAVETLRGRIETGDVVSRRVRTTDRRPVPYVTVQVAEHVSIECPQRDVHSP